MSERRRYINRPKRERGTKEREVLKIFSFHCSKYVHVCVLPATCCYFVIFLFFDRSTSLSPTPSGLLTHDSSLSSGNRISCLNNWNWLYRSNKHCVSRVFLGFVNIFLSVSILSMPDKQFGYKCIIFYTFNTRRHFVLRKKMKCNSTAYGGRRDNCRGSIHLPSDIFTFASISDILHFATLPDLQFY